MTALLQDTNGDFKIINGRLRLTDGKLEVAQTIRSRLRVFQGELFLDITAGTPYFQQVIGKDKNPNTAESAIKSVITSTPGVLELLEFSFNIDKATREASVAFKVRAEDGIIELEEDLA